jgi:hypothetical protein
MRATRRRLLAATGCAALTMTSVHPADPLVILARRLNDLLGRPAAAHHIAAAYLAGIGGVDWRRAALELDMPAILAPLERIAGVAEARAWLDARVRSDFEAGAVMDVDGWRLSRAEVGTCVLVTGVA